MLEEEVFMKIPKIMEETIQYMKGRGLDISWLV